jgi:uncharacterized membrane protein YbhN (UPF0104 family)
MSESAKDVGLLRRIGAFGRKHALALWLIVVPILTVVLLVRHWQEVGQISDALRRAHPRWILVGFGIEVVTIVASALTYKVLLRRLGHPLSWPMLAGAHLRRVAVGALFFFNGPASVVVFLRILKQRHVSTDDGLLTIGLRSVASQGAFIVVLVGALMVHGANQASIVVAVFLAATVFAVLLLRSRWHYRLPWVHRLPFGLGERATVFLARLRGHRLELRDLSWPAVFMLVGRIGPIGLLFASLRALDVDTTLSMTIAAYLAAFLAHMMVPVFQGAGVVEAAAAVALTQSGVPAETAIGVALLWRLLDFWMVFAAGLAIHALASLSPRLGERRSNAAYTPRTRSFGFGLRSAPSPLAVPASVSSHPSSSLIRDRRTDH